jgi:dipeptidyl aminopeptidase/acylaminoacyl peptidase
MRSILLLPALASAILAAEQLDLRSLVTAKEFGINLPPSIRPGDREIAYTVNDPRSGDNFGTRIDERFRTGLNAAGHSGAVYVTDIETKTAVRITGAEEHAWSPVWSPDGKALLYASDREDGQARLWIWDPVKRSSTMLSGVVLRGDYSWSPDSRFVLARALPAGMTPGAYAAFLGGDRPGPPSTSGPVTATVFRSRQSDTAPPSFNLRTSFADLAIIDMQSQTVRRMISRANIHWAAFSPDGKSVLAITSTGFAGHGSNQILYDVSVMPAGGGATIFKKSGVLLIGADHVSWSPDGTMLSYKTADEVGAWRLDGTTAAKADRAFGRGFDTDNRPPRWEAGGRYLCFTAGAHAVYALDVTAGAANQLADFENRWVEFLFDRAGRIWSPPGEQRVTIITHDNLSGRNTVEAVSLADAKRTTLFDTDENIGGLNVPYGFAVSPERTHVAWLAESAQRPPDLWFADSSFANPRRITTLNPGLSETSLGSVKLLEWE